MVSWEEFKKELEEFPVEDRLVYLKELLEKLKGKKGKNNEFAEKIKKEIGILEKELSKDRSWQAGGEVVFGSKLQVKDDEKERRQDVVSRERIDRGGREESLEDIAGTSPVMVKAETAGDEGLAKYVGGGGGYMDFDRGYKKIDAGVSEKEMRERVEKGVVDYAPKTQVQQQMDKMSEESMLNAGGDVGMSGSEKIIKETEKYKRGKKEKEY
ncbi:MAG: hypothetical protein KKG60_00750 [Nanoarchaeota archaeon]|nr:hypothetical protein [Nanoarchaeota archaeon]